MNIIYLFCGHMCSVAINMNESFLYVSIVFLIWCIKHVWICIKDLIKVNE